MSPAPPPRGGPPRKGGSDEHPAERGAAPRGPAPKGGPAPRGPAPKGGPARGPAPKAPPQEQPRAGKYFEVRKGVSPDGKKTTSEEDDDEPIGAIALPRSITQEQEEEDLKRRLNKDEDEQLIDLSERHGAVKLVGAPAEARSMGRRSSGIWLLVVVVLLAAAAFAADRFKLVDKLKGTQPAQQPAK